MALAPPIYFGHETPMQNTERWMPVPSMSARYEVSNMGNIKRISCLKAGTRTILPERILCATKNSRGYLGVTWDDDNQKKHWSSVARAVALAFIPNPDNKLEVNHINGVKTDNRLENLEWATRKENVDHSNDVLGHRGQPNRIVIRGEAHSGSKLKKEQVAEIIETKAILSHRKAAIKYGVSVSCIYHVRKGHSWKAV